MLKQEARKHHYIPRFILRNFNDETGLVYYWNIKKKRLQKKNVKNIFLNIDMYRDELLHEEDPTQIETKFSVFEKEIAELIKEKILCSTEIVLTRRELEKMRIFMTLMAFRSNIRMEQYKNNSFDEETRNILLQYQPNDDFVELWKRELDVLAASRTYKEIEESEVIDPIIKQDFMNDLFGYYMTFVDARGGDFLLTDVYPTLEVIPIGQKGKIGLHYFFPLSPTRMLVLNHIMFKEQKNKFDPFLSSFISFSQIGDKLIVPPVKKYKSVGIHTQDDIFTYNVRKIYITDVIYINALFLNESRIGFIFKDKSRIYDSIISFNKRVDTKQKFLEMEKDLE